MTNSPLLGGVLVYGRLVFDEGNFMLHSIHVTVFGGGEFLIGSCDCPYQGKARIELHNPTLLTTDHYGQGTKVARPLVLFPAFSRKVARRAGWWPT